MVDLIAWGGGKPRKVIYVECAHTTKISGSPYQHRFTWIFFVYFWGSTDTQNLYYIFNYLRMESLSVCAVSVSLTHELIACNWLTDWVSTWAGNSREHTSLFIVRSIYFCLCKVNVFYFYVFYADLFVCYFYKDPWWNHEPLLIDGMSKTLSAGDPDKPPH